MFTFRKNKHRSVFLSIVGLTASAALALGPATSTHAASSVQQTATTSQPRISMERLNTRVAQLPELASLKNGDLVTVYDDGSVTGLTWEGTYVWRPAGSQVRLTDMYARWGDGLVAINMQTDPADASDELNANVKQPFATFIEQEYAKTTNEDGDEVVTAIGQQQVTKRLIQEPTNANIWRIPNNAWLFRSAGNGQYTALVDVLEFRSGGTPVRQEETETTNEWVEEGTQPVGVAIQE
jgi:hypothetical protein